MNESRSCMCFVKIDCIVNVVKSLLINRLTLMLLIVPEIETLVDNLKNNLSLVILLVHLDLVQPVIIED